MYELQQQQPSRRGSRLPDYEQLRTVKTALEVFVLALAVPWLIHELFRDPGSLTRKIAGHHMGGK